MLAIRPALFETRRFDNYCGLTRQHTAHGARLQAGLRLT
jgi:hypothetical protein